MYLGRYQQGQSVHLFLLTRTPARVPTVPDDVPGFDVYDQAGAKVESGKLPVEDRYVQTGLFHLPLFLGQGYAAGQYRVAYRWAISGTTYQADAGFEITPGGHADGAVLAAFYYRRPHADFVLQQLESGSITKGRNPTV